MTESPTRGAFNFWRTHKVVGLMFRSGYDPSAYDWRPPRKYDERAFMRRPRGEREAFAALWRRDRDLDPRGRPTLLADALTQKRGDLDLGRLRGEQARSSAEGWLRRVSDVPTTFADDLTRLEDPSSWRDRIDAVLGGRVSPETFLVLRDLDLAEGRNDVLDSAATDLLGGVLFTRYARLLRAYRKVLSVDADRYALMMREHNDRQSKDSETCHHSKDSSRPAVRPT